MKHFKLLTLTLFLSLSGFLYSQTPISTLFLPIDRELDGNISTKINSAEVKTKTEYNINGEPRTEQDVINILNDKNLTDEEMSNIRINIVGNPSLEAKVKDKQRKSSIGKDIDKTITDSKDRQTLIDLEIERLVLEQNNGKKGVFKKVNN
ncbi:MAG: hypothetical protein HN833_01345, partial [Elusimicrobiaceae bacterium]|nr:hypothetical protein [Elusimicrobiaceae bacterium]